MIRLQRQGALRVSCAYRTVSEVLVIAGIIPIKPLARERKLIYDRKKEGDPDNIKADVRRATMLEWQTLWEDRADSAWTRRLIKEVAPWSQREHGEVNYFLTQFLSGHGLFQSYLSRMGKVVFPECVFCPDKQDNACHTFFDCDRWTIKKMALEAEIGEITPDNIVEKMLPNEESWIKYVEDLLRTKNLLTTP